MLRPSRGTENPFREARPAGPDTALTLLDAKQWSYLKKRYDLTPRELEIADLVCRGLENDLIAKHLDIRPGTVKAHVRNIYRKVKVSSKIRMLLQFVFEASERAVPPRRGPLQSAD